MFRSKASIASLVAIALGLATTLVLGAFALFDYQAERSRQAAQLHLEHSISADQVAVSLALPVWNFDRAQIDKAIESAMLDENVYAVVCRLADVNATLHGRVRDGQWKNQFIQQEPSADGLLVESRKVTGGGDLLGTVRVYVTPRFMERRLRQSLTSLILNIVVTDTVLIGCLYIALWHLVLNPIKALEQHAWLASAGGGTPVAPVGLRFKGELEGLRSSLDRMLSLLKARYEALRESEEKFSKAFRSSPNGLVISEMPDGRYLEVNESLARLYGFTQAEMIGRTWQALAIWEDENDQKPFLASLRAHGSVRDLEVRHRTRSGEPKSILVSAELVELGGRPCFVSVLHDITDRVQAEQSLRESQRILSTLLSNLPGLVYRCANNLDRTMEFVSDGSRALTGYPPAELIGHGQTTYGGLIHPEDRRAIWDQTQAALREHRPFELTYRIHTAVGTEKWVWERGQGVFSTPVELVAIEGFINDITAQRHAETEREEAEWREREARQEYTRQLIAHQEAERRRIAGELHDSLGQNLLLIKNRSQLALAHESILPQLLLQLEGINELAAQAIAEVRQISHDLRPYQLDQLGLTRALDVMLANAAESTEVAFTRKLDPVDDVFLQEATIHFYRIVQECLNNIMKHASARHVTIELERDVCEVRFQITDDGRGFERDATDRPGLSRGFGLRNIAERVRILGGVLSVHSVTGHGTRLEVVIPIPEFL